MSIDTLGYGAICFLVGFIAHFWGVTRAKRDGYMLALDHVELRAIQGREGSLLATKPPRSAAAIHDIIGIVNELRKEPW